MASGLGAGPCYVPCKRHTPPRPGLREVEVIFIPISKKRKWRPEGLNSLCEVKEKMTGPVTVECRSPCSQCWSRCGDFASVVLCDESWVRSLPHL